MEKYLNMSDVFDGKVKRGLTVNGPSVHGDNHKFYAHAADEDIAEYTAHAINSHDELVAMNNELLAALEEISNLPSYRQDECSDMAREAIAKAKGGAA